MNKEPEFSIILPVAYFFPWPAGIYEGRETCES